MLNEDGKKQRSETIRGPWPKAVQRLERLGQPFSVCYEASLGYGYLYDAIKQVAASVIVAHPGHLRLIFRSKKKNDRADAYKLAKLLFLDEVPTMHVPSSQVRNWRGIIEYRVRLVNKRTEVKNALRGILRDAGIAARKCLWGRGPVILTCGFGTAF